MGNFEGNVLKEGVITLSEAGKKAPKIIGIKTGVKGLDDMFFTSVLEKGKPKKKSLGGYPSYSVVNITGIPDTGKSLMTEQFLITQAKLGQKVCLVSVESPAAFVAATLRERAGAMGVEYESIEDNIFIIDVASHYQLRSDLPSLMNTLAYAIKEYGIKHTVIDSVTGFFEEKEMLARGVVRTLFNFMKKWHQTAIFISQKRSGHEELTAEAAGGYAVSHIVDCSIVLSKITVTTKYEEKMYSKPVGEIVRLIRIDGCRLCGHDTSVHVLDIDEKGIVSIGPKLSDLTSSSKK